MNEQEAYWPHHQSCGKWSMFTLVIRTDKHLLVQISTTTKIEIKWGGHKFLLLMFIYHYSIHLHFHFSYNLFDHPFIFIQLLHTLCITVSVLITQNHCLSLFFNVTFICTLIVTCICTVRLYIIHIWSCTCTTFWSSFIVKSSLLPPWWYLEQRFK